MCGRMGGSVEGVILFLLPTTSDFFNSFHITYRLVLLRSPAHGPNPCTKGEDYRKSGKTKLITRGISTSQCCLKCNYMGLELWLRLGWLQISHWQTCSRCKIWLPLKMTAGERRGVDQEISSLDLINLLWKLADCLSPVPEELPLKGVPLEKHHKSGFSGAQTHKGANRMTQDGEEDTAKWRREREKVAVPLCYNIYLNWSIHHTCFSASSLER